MYISSRFKKQNSDLSHIEIDKVLSFVCYIGAEITADNAVPGGVVFLVKLLLDKSGDVLK